MDAIDSSGEMKVRRSDRKKYNIYRIDLHREGRIYDSFDVFLCWTCYLMNEEEKKVAEGKKDQSVLNIK